MQVAASAPQLPPAPSSQVPGPVLPLPGMPPAWPILRGFRFRLALRTCPTPRASAWLPPGTRFGGLRGPEPPVRTSAAGPIGRAVTACPSAPLRTPPVRVDTVFVPGPGSGTWCLVSGICLSELVNLCLMIFCQTYLSGEVHLWKQKKFEERERALTTSAEGQPPRALRGEAGAGVGPSRSL